MFYCYWTCSWCLSTTGSDHCQFRISLCRHRYSSIRNSSKWKFANKNIYWNLSLFQKKDILGGTKTVPILADGSIVFDSLSLSESSTKHKEREFCLEFVLLRHDGQELMRKQSRAFYAYSHKKVLQRRGSVKLRTLSKSWGSMAGKKKKSYKKI